VKYLFVVLATVALATSCAPSAPTEKTPVAPAAPAGVVEAYRAWVEAQADTLLTQTEAFVAAYQAGDRAKAQNLYPGARMPYERIEPIAEALGDFDPRIDAREGDVPADQWSGFHRLEKVLWSKTDLATEAATAKTLLDTVRLLRAKIETTDISVPSMVTGAVELLNEVSTSKVTGEEERYSHTDLWDFQANVEGAAKIYELLAPTVRTQAPDLANLLDQRLPALLALLGTHARGQGYQLYPDLKPEEVKALVAAVDGVAEPLAQMGKLFPTEGK